MGWGRHSSHHDGSATSGSRVLPLRGGVRRMKAVPLEHSLVPPRTHRATRDLDLLSYRCSHQRRLSRLLIKPDIYSGTASKSPRGENGTRRAEGVDL